MTDQLLCAAHGPVGTITLNRPRALNALTLTMIRALRPRLAAWAADPAIRAVVIRGAGDRAFCAGGDVLAIWRSIVEDLGGQGPSDLSKAFFFEEYQLNHEINTYPKPYIALLDGITMGGGVGLSVHGRYRVVTERFMFAMPETGIGLFPDVGGGWFLPRLPGETGTWLALTGDRLRVADALALGIATHHVPAERLDALQEALAATDWGTDPFAAADACLARFATDPGLPPVAAHRPSIDACFAGDSVAAILEALRRDGSGFARKAAAAIAGKSPTSLKVTLEQLRRGGRLSRFGELLAMEYRLSQHFMAGHDFFEGIRALLVDKDNKPKWRPDRLEDVTATDVAACFAPVAGRELDL